MQGDQLSLFTSGSTPAGVGYSEDRLASVLLERIKNSEKDKIKWEDRFKCQRMEEYYEGKQWEDTGTNYDPYCTNLIYATIEVQLPTLLFSNPIFHVKPKPANSSYDYTSAIKKAQLREDITNTFIQSPSMNFAETSQMGVRDAFFRFGIFEIGYSADWIDNPNADQPILRSDTHDDFYKDAAANVIKQPKRLPQNERIYVKRIQPENFYVSALSNGGLSLEHYDWCAYWDWYRIEDIVANPAFKNRDKIHWAGGRSTDYIPDDFYNTEIRSMVSGGDLAKVWKFFDNRGKKKYVLLDSPGLVLLEEKFKRLPLKGLRFSLRSKGWYPLPPATNWKSPQDEYNEAREQMRNHRKRFIRKYLYLLNAFQDSQEKEKLLHGGDGTFIGVSATDINSVVVPVPNADLGSDSSISLQLSQQDFNIVSGTMDNDRGTTNKTTATQSNIINQKSQIRSSLVKIRIANWLNEIATEVLLQAEEKITSPLWVKMTVPHAKRTQALNSLSKMLEQGGDQQQLLDEQEMIEDVREVWNEITVDDLNDPDREDSVIYEVAVNVDSMSPIDQGQDSQTFIAFLSVLAQFPEIASDPDLIQEAAYRLGYRNDKVIRKMVKAAELMLAQKLQASLAGGGSGGSPPQMAQQTVANAQPPAMEQIQNQMNNSQTALPLQ